VRCGIARRAVIMCQGRLLPSKKPLCSARQTKPAATPPGEIRPAMAAAAALCFYKIHTPPLPQQSRVLHTARTLARRIRFLFHIEPTWQHTNFIVKKTRFEKLVFFGQKHAGFACFQRYSLIYPD
jgi:hypothetical protein